MRRFDELSAEELQFLNSISREDLSSSGVYADWLEENGWPQRAQAWRWLETQDIKPRYWPLSADNDEDFPGEFDWTTDRPGSFSLPCFCDHDGFTLTNRDRTDGNGSLSDGYRSFATLAEAYHFAEQSVCAALDQKLLEG